MSKNWFESNMDRAAWHEKQARENNYANLKRAATKEAMSTWINPTRLGIIFVVALCVTFYYNGL